MFMVFVALPASPVALLKKYVIRLRYMGSDDKIWFSHSALQDLFAAPEIPVCCTCQAMVEIFVVCHDVDY